MASAATTGGAGSAQPSAAGTAGRPFVSPAGTSGGTVTPPSMTPRTSAGSPAPAAAGTTAPRAGRSGGGAGSSSAAGSGIIAVAGSGVPGMGAAGAGAAGSGETGRMVGITAAHNVVRARLMNPSPTPALPPLAWSSDIAKTAQAYAEKLASGGDCLNLVHSQAPGLGENLAGYQGQAATPMQVVEGWAGEEPCFTFGPITAQGTECDMTCAKSKFSNGCGHYTQVVWRGTTEVGCGVATCGSGRSAGEVWVCNYRKQGNIIGQKPY